MSKFCDLFMSKDQYLVDSSTDFRKKIPEIVNIINQSAKIDFDWSKGKYTGNLNAEQLLRIQKAVAGDAQSKMVEIFSTYIEPFLKESFGDQLTYKIRVGAQIKGCWPKEIAEEVRIGFVDDDGIWCQDREKPALCFPTRAHQDLDNNGNRSSHTIIFYFQLTPAFDNTSTIEFGEFPDKIGIWPFSSEWGYPNEILHSTQKQLHWNSPDLTPGNILMMTAINPHRSRAIGEMPRVALNVKIQPSNLGYLEHIYGVSLSALSGETNLQDKLHIIKDTLIILSEKQRLLLFELAITYFLIGDKKKSIKTLNRLCLFNITDQLWERWMLASILKKNMFQVTDEDLAKSSNPLDNIVALSAGDAIIETVRLYSNSK